MAAATSKTPQAADPCPDPSAHNTKNPKLQDQASKAALYVTHPTNQSSSSSHSIDPLGPDGKLSSSSAAASLKHAAPHELPSFPSIGLDNPSSGTQAANLAHQNQKPFEHWKPELSSSAGRAALLAHKDGGKVDLWQPSSSGPGHSAAGIAMGKQRHLSPQIHDGHTPDGHKKALLAATKSASGRRTRSGSTPSMTTQSYPDAENSSFNALNAATVAHRPSSRYSNNPDKLSMGAAMEAARAKNAGQNVPREMYTDHAPNAGDSVEEKQHKAALRASTVSMAKQTQASEDSQDRMNYPTGNLREDAKNYLNLQAAAQRMASERLGKLDPDGVAAYRAHYGYPGEPKRSKLSVRRRRKSEGQEPSMDDEERAGRIRKQMNHFNDKLASVDAKLAADNNQKQTQDRSNLMEAAERSVHARMSKMDKQVFEETGKVTPAMMEEWEAKARAKAAAESEQRLEKHGLVNVGGGKYLSNTEVEAIAQERMQPTLDEIGDNAEKQRARDEEIRLDQEQRKRQTFLEKERTRQLKAESKARAKQEKSDEKERKAMEKEHQKALKRLEKQEDRENRNSLNSKETERSKTESTSSEDEVRSDEEHIAAPLGASETKDSERAKPSEGRGDQPTTKAEDTAAKPTVEDPPGVPTKFVESSDAPEEGAKVDTSKADESPPSTPSSPKKEPSKRDSRIKGFFGKFKRSSRTQDGAKSPEHRPKSSEAKANSESTGTAGVPAGTDGEAGSSKAQAAKSPSPSLSSSSLASETGNAAKSNKDEARKSRKSKQSAEDVEEARDRFDSEDLKKPEPAFSRTSKDSSPQRSKFREEV